MLKINMKNTEQASAVYALLMAGGFVFLSFYDTDAETYLFPRIIALVLVLLALVLFIVNMSSKGDNRKDSSYFSAIWPGLLIGVIYLLVMEALGFYLSSAIAFLSITLLYGKRNIWDKKALLTKLSISLAFLLILYLLFWKGLHVMTPTGLVF